MLADHIAAIDESLFELRLFGKGMDPSVLLDAQGPEAARGMNGGQSTYLAGSPVRNDAGVDIDRRETVAVGQQKWLPVRNVALNRLDPVGGHRVFAGVGKRDVPVLFIVPVVAGDVRLAAQIQRDVTGVPKVVPEIIFDHIALVAEAQHKVPVAVVGVGLHDVPQDGPVADGDHRFGTIFRLFTETGALSSAENDDFHNSCETSGASRCHVFQSSLGLTQPIQRPIYSFPISPVS